MRTCREESAPGCTYGACIGLADSKGGQVDGGVIAGPEQPARVTPAGWMPDADCKSNRQRCGGREGRNRVGSHRPVGIEAAERGGKLHVDLIETSDSVVNESGVGDSTAAAGTPPMVTVGSVVRQGGKSPVAIRLLWTTAPSMLVSTGEVRWPPEAGTYSCLCPIQRRRNR